MQIVLDLCRMELVVRNKKFVSLVMNEVKERKYSDVSDDGVNLFKPVLFELFGNVQEMVVITAYKYVYAFDLSRLLQYAFPKSLKKLSVKGKWLEKALTDSMRLSISGNG